LVGVAAFLLAAALIATAVLTGSLPGVQNVNTTGTQTGTGGTTTGTGSLSILLTDPPITPANVTKVYVSYSDIMIHVSNAGNKSGWYPVDAKGTIELLGTVNISQTLATVKIASGTYNFLRFNITSAAVTYLGKNYTAFVRTAMLEVPIIGGVQVNDSKPSATVIDLQTTVVNIGSRSDPEFMIRPVVAAYPVPPGQVTTWMQERGYRLDLIGQPWWRHIAETYTANLNITAASLSATSLSVTVKDTGNSSTVLDFVTVSQLTASEGGRTARGHIADALMTSQTFLVLKNGTLVPIRDFSADVLAAWTGGPGAKLTAYEAIFGQAGYNLSKGATATFTYSGQISIGFRIFGLTPTSVVSGQEYTITVLGTQAVAAFVVKAS